MKDYIHIFYGISFSLVQMIHVYFRCHDILYNYDDISMLLKFLMYAIGFVSGIFIALRKKVGALLFCFSGVIEFSYNLLFLIFYVPLLILALMGAPENAGREFFQDFMLLAIETGYLLLGILLLAIEYGVLNRNGSSAT